jgi:protein-tyrosine phosphatase
MSDVFDWPNIADPQAVLRRAVRALHAGRAVVFPTQTSYVAVARAASSEALGRLRERHSSSFPPALAVRGEPEALKWAPALSVVGRRLARRCWPGPVVLAVAGAVPDSLPEGVRALVCGSGGLRLWTPDHETLLETLYQVEEPVVVAGVAGNPEELAAQSWDDVELIITDGIPSGQVPTIVRLDGDQWAVVRPGIVPQDEIARHTNCLIVFVCTGNTCRSPLAEALFKKRLADRLGCTVEELPARGFSVLSAGVAAMMGAEAAAEAVEVVRSYGADLAQHRSRPLSVELAAQADSLIGMTGSHVTTMREYYPRLAVEPRLLSPSGEDIADPVGCSRDVYEECARQIWQALEPLLPL